MIIATCTDCFKTELPHKEYETDKLPPTRRTWDVPKGGRRYQSIICCQHPRTYLDWERHAPPRRAWVGSNTGMNKMIIQKQLGKLTSLPQNLNCEPCSRAVLLDSPTLMLPTGCLFPIKSFALSEHASPQFIYEC